MGSDPEENLARSDDPARPPQGDGDFGRDDADLADVEDGSFDPEDVIRAATADGTFRKLLEKLNAEHGFDFREYKEASLVRRIRRRMRQVRIDTYDAYATLLDRHPDEHKALIDSIIIKITRFFRDPEAWAALAEKVIPQLLEDAAESRCLRIWSAGCASGEEPFSAAILVAEGLRVQPGAMDVKIYATDIDENALGAARTGLFRLEQLKEIPAPILSRYFVAEGPQTYRIARDVRKWCIFGQHNLVRDAPLSHIDLLICRNVLIYFNSELQDRVLPRFHYALRDRGFLFLGRSESLLARSRRFVAIDSKWRIFQRLSPSVPTPTLAPHFAAPGEDPTAQAVARHVRAESQQLILRGVIDALKTAVMVIDPSDAVLLWNPGAEALFELPLDAAIGRKFRDLNVSYRVEGLRARIEEVKQKRAPARMDGVSIQRRSGDAAHASFTIAPLFDERQRLSGVLVLADDVTDGARLREEMSRLGEEYATATEELQSTNEELETANEELQSTNEELETTNEELQAINAELATLNTELERRTAALNDLNEYHRSILGSLDEGIFVLDRAFGVTSWNPSLGRLLRLGPNDAGGRDFFSLPLGDGTGRLREAVARVLETRKREVVRAVNAPGAEGGTTSLRLTPLVDSSGTVVGVVGVAVSDGRLPGEPERGGAAAAPAPSASPAPRTGGT
jgi:two-component system CheB/CheR fusion protein